LISDVAMARMLMILPAMAFTWAGRSTPQLFSPIDEEVVPESFWGGWRVAKLYKSLWGASSALALSLFAVALTAQEASAEIVPDANLPSGVCISFAETDASQCIVSITETVPGGGI
jgi:hypothetical protein